MLNLSAIAPISFEQFNQFCQDNPDVVAERSKTGELILMPPTGFETSVKNADIIAQLHEWNRKTQLGYVTESNGLYRLSLFGGGDRAPDAAWISKERVADLPPKERSGFLPVAPNFVIELRSNSDSLVALQEKMEEYLSCGVELGWLISPPEQIVYVYRNNFSLEVKGELSIDASPVLPGFVLDLRGILLDSHTPRPPRQNKKPD